MLWWLPRPHLQLCLLVYCGRIRPDFNFRGVYICKMRITVVSRSFVFSKRAISICYWSVNPSCFSLHFSWQPSGKSYSQRNSKHPVADKTLHCSKIIPKQGNTDVLSGQFPVQSLLVNISKRHLLSLPRELLQSKDIGRAKYFLFQIISWANSLLLRCYHRDSSVSVHEMMSPFILQRGNGWLLDYLDPGMLQFKHQCSEYLLTLIFATIPSKQ